MRSVLFAVSALFLYAIANTIVERRLPQTSPLANTTYIYLILLLMSAPLVMFRDQLGFKLVMPDTSHVWPIASCAILFFFADIAWFQAYHTEGGRLEQVAATFLAFPIITALIKGAGSGITPTRSDVVSWIIVGSGLIVSIRQPWK